jgi:hypothetical protein
MKSFMFILLVSSLLGGFGATATAQARLRALGEEPSVTNRASSSKGASKSGESELARQAKAFQRTMAEGVATGAAAGIAADIALGNNNNNGLTIGIGAGALAGSYVARLQRKYSQKEKQLEKVRDDVTRANVELAASIATMQAVLEFQQSELDAIRSNSGSKSKLRKEVAEAKRNLANMNKAISGAQGWQKEFQSTRSLKLVQNQATGVDKDIALLSERIAAMRQVADTLATSISS